MAVEDELRQETEKWRTRLEDRLDRVEPCDGQGKELLENAQAYLRDAGHFQEENDLVRAFEAVVWGWSWLKIGQTLGHIRKG